MSAREVILEKERRLTRLDWSKKTKHTLRLRCADHGLPTTGKKVDLIDRLFTYMHPTGNLLATTAGEYDLDSSADKGENPQQHNTNAPRHPSVENAARALDVTAIRAIIHEEMAARQFYNQSAVQPPILDPVPLSPAAIPMIANAPVTQIHPQLDNTHLAQGLSHFVSTRTCQSLLPPVSEKILKDIKNLQFVDFNTLLPHALYDPPTDGNNLLFELNQSHDGAQMLSLQPAKQQKKKINNAVSWLEAWNIYIRAMAHFHPTLVPELLIYQDFICTLQRSYPSQSWLRYDTAFRLHIALDHTISWSSIDDHAFNKFVRCAAASTKIKCFICASDNHLANTCPQRLFRPKRESSSATGQTTPFQTGPTCKFFNSPKTHCDQRRCRYNHKCSSCGGNHPAFKCSYTLSKF